MRAVIICGGDIGSAERAKALINDSDMIICADSGYRYIDALGVEPHIVLGDFDSYKKEDINCINTKTYPAKKDFTDSEIAARYALEQGADEILLLAAMGGRIDHALANIYLLKTIYESGAKAMIFDGVATIWYAKDEISVSGKKGDLLSIIPFDEASDLSTEGLEYALSHESLPSTGVSNVFLGDRARVKIGKGAAIVVYSPKELAI